MRDRWAKEMCGEKLKYRVHRRDTAVVFTEERIALLEEQKNIGCAPVSRNLMVEKVVDSCENSYKAACAREMM